MKTVNISQARIRLSQLVNIAVAGEDVVISRNGKALVRITRLPDTQSVVKFGKLKGKVKLSGDFDNTLPADVLAGFEGGRCV
jgi:prevent-host-death family protein